MIFDLHIVHCHDKTHIHRFSIDMTHVLFIASWCDLVCDWLDVHIQLAFVSVSVWGLLPLNWCSYEKCTDLHTPETPSFYPLSIAVFGWSHLKLWFFISPNKDVGGEDMNGFYKWLAGTKLRMSNHRSPGEERCTEMKDFMVLRKRTSRGNFQSVQHWNCFKHNTWETSGRQRRGQSTKGLSHACKYLVELNLNCMIHQLDHLVECINTGNSAYLVEMFFNSYHQLVLLNQVLWAHETVWFDIFYFGLVFWTPYQYCCQGLVLKQGIGLVWFHSLQTFVLFLLLHSSLFLNPIIIPGVIVR